MVHVSVGACVCSVPRGASVNNVIESVNNLKCKQTKWTTTRTWVCSLQLAFCCLCVGYHLWTLFPSVLWPYSIVYTWCDSPAPYACLSWNIAQDFLGSLKSTASFNSYAQLVVTKCWSCNSTSYAHLMHTDTYLAYNKSSLMNRWLVLRNKRELCWVGLSGFDNSCC